MEGARKCQGVAFIKEVVLSECRDSGEFGAGIVREGRDGKSFRRTGRGGEGGGERMSGVGVVEGCAQ